MKFRELEIGDLFTTTLDGFGVKQKLNNNALHNYVQVVKGVNSMESGLLGDYSRDGNVRKVRAKDDAGRVNWRTNLKFVVCEEIMSKSRTKKGETGVKYITPKSFLIS